MNDYFNCIYGWWCCWNKLYLKDFLNHYKILFPNKFGDDRFFSFQCVFNSQRYVKIPNIVNVYRNISLSSSRQPASTDHLQKSIRNLNDFAAGWEECTKNIDFFKKHPDYRFKLMDVQLSDCISMSLKYYPNNQMIIPEVLNSANQEIEKIFHKNAPFVKWLFHRYHMLFRQLLELKTKN